MAAPPKRDPRRYGTTNVRVRDLKVCFYCSSSPLPETIVFCPSCGFPQRGSELEQKRFIVGRKQLGKNVNESEASIGIARIVLFALGLLDGAVAAWCFSQGNRIDGIAYASIAAIYIGLGLWAGKKPFPALLTGLIVYLTFLLLAAIVDPASILSGLILKIAIGSAFVYGMRAVKNSEDLRKQMQVQKMDLSDAENPVDPS
jgi:hypothetical protein